MRPSENTTPIAAAQPMPAGDPLLRRLQRLATRVGADRIAARLALVAGPIALLPLIVVGLDHAVAGGLPRGLMGVCGPLWGVLALAGVIWAWRTGRNEQPGALSAARLYERTADVPHNTLVNALLVRADPERRFAHAAAAIESARAVSMTPADVDFERVAPRRTLLVVTVVVAAWALYAWFAPKPVSPSLARFFGAALPAPTATRIEWVRPRPGDPIYVGDSLEIEVRVGGQNAEAVWFERLPSPDSLPAHPAQRLAFVRGRRSDSGDHWRLTLAPHETAPRIRYRVSAGDTALTGELNLLPQPAEQRARLIVTPPTYTGESPFTSDAPDVRVWSGSRVEFVFEANTAVHDPVLVLASASQTQRVQMAVSGEQRGAARVSLPVRQGAAYWYEFEDAWGRPAVEGARRTLRVRNDEAPSVRIVDPQRGDATDERYEIAETPRLVVVARDDIRLTDLTLVVERSDRTERRRLAIADARPIRERRLAIATHDLQVTPGQELRCWFEARDNHRTYDGRAAAQAGRSRTITLTRAPATPDVAPAPQRSADDGDPPSESGPAGDGMRERVRGVRPGDVGGEATAGESGSSESGAAGDAGAGEAAAGQAATGDAGAAGSPAGGVMGRAEGDAGEATPADGPPSAGSGTSGGEAGDQPAAGGGEQKQLGERLRDFARRFGREAKKLAGRKDDAPGDDDGPDSGDGGEAHANRPSGSDADSPQSPPVDSPASQPAAEDAGDEQASEPQTDAPASDPPASQPANGSGAERSTDADESDAESEQASQAADSSGNGSAEDAPSTSDAESRSSEGDSPEESTSGSQPSAAGEGAQQQPTGEGEQSDSQGAGAGGGEDSSAGGGGGGTTSDAAGDSAEGGASSDSSAGETAGGTSGATDDDAAAQGGGGEDAGDSSAGGAGGGGGEQAGESPGGGAHHDETADEMNALLELLDRYGELREDDLDDLGLSEEQRLEFIREFERLKQAAAEAGVLGELRRFATSAEIGSTDVARGESGVIGVAAEASQNAGYADGLPPIVAPREQRAPPELQAILDAYYRSLAARRTRPPTAEDD